MSSVAVLAVGAELLVRALELAGERLQDLEGRDVDEQRVRLAVAVGHDLGREVLADARAVLLAGDVPEDPVALGLDAAARHERHALLLGLLDLLGDRVAVDGVEDHRVGALAKRRLERVLELLGRAVGADRRGGPAEVGRALLDDVALDLAGLDAAADEDDLLAGWDVLADRRRRARCSSAAWSPSRPASAPSPLPAPPPPCSGRAAVRVTVAAAASPRRARRRARAAPCGQVPQTDGQTCASPPLAGLT